MDFLKKHYEKLILSGVLLGLAVTTWLMATKADQEKSQISDLRSAIIKMPPKELPPVDLTNNLATLSRLKNPPPVQIAAGHNVFNPVVWKRKGETIIKIATGSELGAGALVVTNIAPLYLIISLDDVIPGEKPQYKIGIERQASSKISERRKAQRTAGLNQKNDLFALRQVVGPADTPSAVVIELNDNREEIRVARDASFKRVAGFSADLVYPPEKKTFPGTRVGANLPLEGETYKVVSVGETEVTVQAPNGKRTILAWLSTNRATGSTASAPATPRNSPIPNPGQ